MTLSFTIFFGQKNLNRAHMLFQVLCGFEPIFYTTHPNEEPDFITICFIIGGNYYWKHTIKEGIYKACKDGAAAFVHGVSDAFTLSICF